MGIRARYASVKLAVTIYFGLLFMATSAEARLSGAELDALVPVIITAESSGNPKAVGDGGKARGLMQIQKATWKRFSGYPWDDAFDENKNVQVGQAILERINEEYGDKATRARVIFTYNTGRYAFGDLPNWTKRHPNNVYRKIFTEAKQ